MHVVFCETDQDCVEIVLKDVDAGKQQDKITNAEPTTEVSKNKEISPDSLAEVSFVDNEGNGAHHKMSRGHRNGGNKKIIF